MKKVLCTFLILTLLLTPAACDKAPGAAKDAPPAPWPSDTSQTPDTPESPSPTPTPEPDPEPEPTLPEPSPEPEPEPEPDFQYADLEGLVFFFASGAGAWSTEVEIQPDGTFTGFFHDADLGGSSDEYPEGTLYVCHFSGKFSQLEKISDFEYSMHCIELASEGTPGDEEIIDGRKVITSTPYGFDDADEFRLYLPGRATSDLPEAFIDWMHGPRNTDWEILETLDFYGLYNVGGEQGFSA